MTLRRIILLKFDSVRDRFIRELRNSISQDLSGQIYVFDRIFEAGGAGQWVLPSDIATLYCNPEELGRIVFVPAADLRMRTRLL